MEDHGGPYTGVGGCALKGNCSLYETTQEEAPGRSCSLWRGDPAGASFLSGTLTLLGPTWEQSVPEGLCPMERTHDGELQPVGSTHSGEVCVELYPERGTPHWSRGTV